MKHDFQQSASTVIGGALHMPVLLPQNSRRPADCWSYPDKTQRSREARIRLQERREERERSAGELHDTLFQEPLAAPHQLGTAVDKMPAGSPVKRSLNRVLCFIRQTIGGGRAASRGLHLSLMTSASLEQALSKMIHEFSPRGARVQLVVTGQSKELKPDTRQGVCLIAREALSNALRHSEASLIEVEIEYQLRTLRLMIRDDGRGMDTKTVRENWHLHWGLQGMHERAKIFGARLGIWSGRGAGTEVEVTIPLSYAANALAQTTNVAQ